MNRQLDWQLDEYWSDLRRFPNYEISNCGRIRNKRNGYILKPFPDRYGYLRVSIGNIDNVPIHRLMAETFFEDPLPEQTCVNHIDCDRSNNEISNLEWCTQRENMLWGIKCGNIDYQKGLDRAIEVNKKPVRIVETNQVFASVKDCAEYLGTSGTNISRILTGSRKGQKVHGYHVEYVNEEDM